MTQDISVVLAADGTYTLDPTEVDNGSSDNCTVTLSLDLTDLDCTNLGTNTVTLTATDESGNSSSDTAVVTVTEANAPVAVASDFTASLDSTGNITVLATQVDGGSTDGCTDTADLSIMFDTTGDGVGDAASIDYACANIGDHVVTIVVEDLQGNTDSDSATISVVDDSAPTVSLLSGLSFSLSADVGAGTITIDENDVIDDATDNCDTALDFMFDTDGDGVGDAATIDFVCANLGENSVTLIATDDYNNSTSVSTTVTIVDDTVPNAIANDITIELDADGVAVLDIDDVAASTDNCGIFDEWVNKTTFDCADLGANTVNFVAEDTSGNQSTTTFVVTVEDNLAPTAVGQDITVSLDANGSVTITGDMLDNGSTDNCTPVNDLTFSVDIDTFDCTDIGANAVVLTVEDAGKF